MWVDGNNLNIVGKHDVGVTKIEYTINGQTYSVESPQGPEMKAVQPVEAGYNRVSIVVYSAEDTQEVLEGEFTL